MLSYIQSMQRDRFNTHIFRFKPCKVILDGQQLVTVQLENCFAEWFGDWIGEWFREWFRKWFEQWFGECFGD